MVTQSTSAPAPPGTRPLLLNNLVAAVIASTVMILLHEATHLVAHLALGHPSLLYPFGVFPLDAPSEPDQVVMLLAAPVVSLVSGAVMQLWTPLRGRGDLLHLVWLWFAFVSVQEGVTYLCLTPFGVGDTGQAAQLLGLPLMVQVLALVLGVGGMLLNARAFAPHLVRHAGDDRAARQAMSFYPWLYGMIVAVLLSILHLGITPADIPPGAQIAIIAAGTSLLVFAPMSNLFAGGAAGVPHEPLRLRAVPVGGLVVLVALVVGNILLSSGLRLG